MCISAIRDISLRNRASRSTVMKQRALSILLVALSAACWLACDDDETQNVGFTTASGSGEESDSVYTVTIDLGRTVSVTTTVNFAIGGQALLDGDYSFYTKSSEPGGISTTPPVESSSLSLTINPGSSTATISFKLIDDTLVEPSREFIYFQLTGISDSDIAAEANNVTYAFEIIDNDVPPTNALQVDLSWNLGDGVSIDQANFDLLLASNITLDEDDNVSSAELVDGVSSIHDTGTETYQLLSSLPDDEYYIIIRYTSGTSDADLSLIMSHDKVYSRAHGTVSSDYSGKLLYYGPIRKNGSSFSSRESEATEPAFHFPSR